MVNSDGPPQLYANQRDGTFRDVAASAGLIAPPQGETTTAVAVGDVNKDDWPDFFFARTGESVLALSDGRGRFNMSAAPQNLRGATAAQFVDYDNDGLLDLVASTAGGLAVARDVGPSWADVTSAAVTPPSGTVPPVRGLAVADVDNDGDEDLVAAGGWVGPSLAEQRRSPEQVAAREATRPGVESLRHRFEGTGARRKPQRAV